MVTASIRSRGTMTSDLGIQLTRGELLMFLILLVLLGAVGVAALVVVYVAYPHRGEQVPRAPWLGEALAKGVSALPVLTEDDAHRALIPRR